MQVVDHFQHNLAEVQTVLTLGFYLSGDNRTGYTHTL
jgi:hypothetical protein